MCVSWWKSGGHRIQEFVHIHIAGKKEIKRKGKDMIIPRYGGVESLLQVCGRLESELELSGES